MKHPSFSLQNFHINIQQIFVINKMDLLPQSNKQCKIASSDNHQNILYFKTDAIAVVICLSMNQEWGESRG